MSKKDVKRAVWVLVVVAVGVLVCSCTEDYEITKWTGSFFLNDSTLGVFKWKYEYYAPKNMFASAGYDNARQYYCEYNINTGYVKRIKKLRNDEGSETQYHYVVYNYPYVYYCTRLDLTDYIGIYNLETKEDEIFKKGSIPRFVSKNNRYLVFEYISHPKFYYGIYDFDDNSTVLGVSYIKRPIYIDEDNKEALLLNFSVVNLESGEVIDSLSLDIEGRILHNASNEITVFESDSGGFYYLNNSELIEGVLEPHKLENLNRYGAGHVDIESEKAVYSTGDGIYYMNYGENKEAELILKYNREDL